MQVGPKPFQPDNSAPKTGQPSEGAVFFSKIISQKSDSLFIASGPNGPVEVFAKQTLSPGQIVKLRLNADQKTAVLVSANEVVPPNESVPSKIIQMLLRSGFSLSSPEVSELIKMSQTLDPLQKRLFLLLTKRLKVSQKQPLDFLLNKIKSSGEEELEQSSKKESFLNAQGLKDFLLQDRDNRGALTSFNHVVDDPSDHWVLVPFEFAVTGFPGKGLFKLNFDLNKGVLKQVVIQLQKEIDSFFVLKMHGQQATECRFYPADAQEAAVFKNAGFPKELAQKYKKIAFHMREERAEGFDGFDDEDLKSIDHRI